MPFPFDIAGETPDRRDLYLVQDPYLRERILPLLRFDPNEPDDRPSGHGTAFRIDPWSRCATAFHVLENLFEVDRAGTTTHLKDNVRLAALELPGQGYGLLPIPRDAWRPMHASFSYFRIDRPFGQAASFRNLIELMVLRIRPASPSESGTPYLPVNLSSWRPSIGERVMAIGYPDLDEAKDGEDKDDPNRPFHQYLYASVGEITDIEPADTRRARPWPMLRIDANWPGGMSGGPVFNEQGHVIGIVSAGFEGEGGATATYFSSWDVPRQIFGSLDPDNPGRFMNWGVFDASGTLVYCGQDKAEIERFARDHGLNDFGMVSIDPVTEEWLRSQVVAFPES
ncbi:MULTISPECIES: S1 family peptidase [unclassified Sphingopyxis]|uniref:S1 family peptidase n=1 Tax=unclassified Sphingopyxis TaxID=2614943 RepID=UPI0007366359|nr:MULTISPECIES: serine protease [unclassified Sphingopyxis]KTE39790.1 hypothetical protein ATE62_08660 [Sphingopyxis sp. HIX]KTE84851.1 hypothetical protein ATE72_06695 [Sphingopyxis sp. HXXIV]